MSTTTQDPQTQAAPQEQPDDIILVPAPGYGARKTLGFVLLMLTVAWLVMTAYALWGHAHLELENAAALLGAGGALTITAVAAKLVGFDGVARVVAALLTPMLTLAGIAKLALQPVIETGQVFAYAYVVCIVGTVASVTLAAVRKHGDTFGDATLHALGVWMRDVACVPLKAMKLNRVPDTAAEGARE